MAEFVAGAADPPAPPYDADVVILSLERAADTVAAIQSALAQRGVSRHVFVVDQGSCPATLAQLAAAVDGQSDATLVSLGCNHGVPGGRNRGSALGHGRVIFGLDNDAVFAEPDTLARTVAALDAEPDLAAIGCRILEGSGKRDDLSSWGYPLALLPRAGDRFDTVTFVGAGHAIRRSAWQDAGPYDEALFFCWEEYDFCLRAIAHGWRIGYCGDIAIRHKASLNQRVAWSGQRWFHFVRNRLYIARKFGADWGGLLPRIAGYIVKGAHNGLLPATLQAVTAAVLLSRNLQRTPLCPAARAYLRAHDGSYRGSWLRRVQQELLAILPAGSQPDDDLRVQRTAVQSMRGPLAQPSGYRESRVGFEARR